MVTVARTALLLGVRKEKGKPMIRTSPYLNNESCRNCIIEVLTNTGNTLDQQLAELIRRTHSSLNDQQDPGAVFAGWQSRVKSATAKCTVKGLC
jgi:hypothetical protein